MGTEDSLDERNHAGAYAGRTGKDAVERDGPAGGQRFDQHPWKVNSDGFAAGRGRMVFEKLLRTQKNEISAANLVVMLVTDDGEMALNDILQGVPCFPAISSYGARSRLVSPACRSSEAVS